MDRDTPPSDKYTSLARVNDQLNYTRRFLGPERAIVSVPTIPYQSFEIFLPGTKVKPWELLNLVISARAFTQWTAKNGEHSDSSIIDSHILMRGHVVFVVALKVEISRHFHDHSSPKFPLLIDVDVTQVGKGSSRRQYVVRHPDVKSHYVACDIDDVLVSKHTRRPVPFPDWWNAKFGYINRLPKKKFNVPPRTDESLIRNECTVEFEHLDHNQHTTFSAYIMFCFNAIFRNITQKHSYGYDAVSLAELNEGIKSMTMVFHKESNFGDRLVLESWEPKGTSHTVNFHIRKFDGTHCSSISIEFYAPLEISSSKL